MSARPSKKVPSKPAKKVAKTEAPKAKNKVSPKASAKTFKVHPLIFWLLMLGAFFFIFQSVRPGKSHLTPPHRVQQIEFSTNGSLDRTWVLKVLQLQKQMELNAVDVQACRTALLRASQVMDVDVERVYPSTLKVFIRERTPIFKIRLPDNHGFYLVDGDGYVFEQIGATKEKLVNVPYLLGLDPNCIRIRDNVPVVKDLHHFWDQARRRAPELVKKWRVAVVDEQAYNLMGRLPFIEVRSEEVRCILFKNDSYAQQFEELEYIIGEAKKRRQLPLLKVDLTVPGRAFVKPSQTNGISR
jgi:cell division septal protein FtsQ